jgi:hypothetical protein
MAKEYFDLIVILPLEVELKEAMKVFSPLKDRCTTMLLVQQPGPGRSNAIETGLDDLR